MTAKGFTDIRPRHWTLRLLPARARPYGRLARWDRPIGWRLLLAPCWWSISLFAPLQTREQIIAWAVWMALFFVGAVAMRGAGCTWNDLLDRDIDAQVERTRDRPLPEYRLTGTLGPDHRKQFLVEVLVDGAPVASASGTSKREAEQEAARLALIRLSSEPAS